MSKLAIISDMHLSYHQYGLNERFNDFVDAFNKNIDSIIHESPDILVIAGDSFDNHLPDNKSRLVFKNAIDLLVSKNIKIAAIQGNHDIINRKDFISPLRVYESDGLILLDNNPIVINETFIAGVDYHTKSKIDDLLEQVEKLNIEAGKYKNSGFIPTPGLWF